jgi:hypothetical protein
MKSNITELKLDDMQNVTGGAVYTLQAQAYGSTTMPKAPAPSLPPPPSLPPIR